MKAFFITLLALFTISASIAQNYDPLTLSSKVFSRDTFPDIKKYSTGDYKGHPTGKDLPPKINITFELLGQTDKTAVVAVTLSDSASRMLNTYMHFTKDSIWKISGFRALAMTGMIEEVYKELSALTPKQIDSVITSAHTKTLDKRMFKSKEEYHYLLGNEKLTLSSDEELIAYFNKNNVQFEGIKNDLVARGIFKSERGTREMRNIGNINKALRRLLIDNVYPNSDETKESLDFFIGGILDNAVGYLYIKDKKNVPKMSPGHFIMIRSLGNGWYLYKTT